MLFDWPTRKSWQVRSGDYSGQEVGDFDTAPEMDRLLRWWWSDPFTRHIHPSSQITVPNFVRRRICERMIR